MKGLLVFLRVAVVGFAVLAGGRALYRNRDKLKGDWRRVGGVEGLKSLPSKVTARNLLGSIGSIRNLATQYGRMK